MKTQLLRYWLAMNASAFDAAVHSCAAFFGVAGVHAAVDTIPALNLKQLAAVFLITFARAILAYLDAHPLSALERGLSQSAARGRVEAYETVDTPMSGGALRVETTRGPSQIPTAPAPTVADSPINPSIQKSNQP